MRKILMTLVLSLTLLSLGSCSRCCEHCPDGEIQRISHISKEKFYRNHYSPPSIDKRQMG